MQRILRQCFFGALTISMLACSGPSAPAASAPANPAPTATSVIEQEDAPVPKTAPAAAPLNAYVAPTFAEAEFHADHSEGTDTVRVDCTESSLGYIAVCATSENRMKVQVLLGETTYTYDLASDGTPSIFPLQCGDGEYTIRVMENVEGKKYAAAYTTSIRVVLENEFVPFLRPNDYASYTERSASTAKAAELAGRADSALGVVTEVYAYINANVRYDYEKAATVQSGYLPKPDETLASGKGICFDYASLAAAMLRSQGIPCKIIFGYVAPNDLYHAWNMFYTEESGWVTVNFQVRGKVWTRLDLTFTANGESDAFIGDGSNYADLYYY